MSEYITINSNRSALLKYADRFTNYSTNLAESMKDTDSELVGFESFPSAYQYRALESAIFYAYMHPPTHTTTGQFLNVQLWYSTTEAWNESTVTFDTQPKLIRTLYKTNPISSPDWTYSYDSYSYEIINHLEEILTNGFRLTYSSSWADYDFRSFPILYTSRSTNKPYLYIRVSDEDCKLNILAGNPSYGYVPKHKSQRFQWSTKKSGNCIGEITVASSKFRWRVDSSSQATEINCGTSLYYYVPADTFSTNSIQWQAEITDSLGNTSTTQWYTLSTVEALPTSIIVSPKNTIIDGSTDTVFSWQHIISTGTAQTKADLQYSTDGATWSSLATVTGSNTQKTISAGTFTSGQKYWRVRTYNTDDTAGEWSASGPFLVIAAPAEPAVSATQTPRPTVSWQTSEQQGFQVVIDGLYDSGTKFGTANSFVLPIYLDDGNYTVKVRVQNSFGLWSNYGEAPIAVQNTAGPSITLEVSGTLLTWTQRTSYSAFIVYRDGKAIAKTTEFQYNDIYAIGEHDYKVRGIYAGSANYGLSNIVTTEISVERLQITDVETGETLPIEYSTQVISEVFIFQQATSVLTHITSADYPFLEKSRFKNKTANINFAFPKGDKRIETYFNKIVVLKTPEGSSVVGMLDNMSITESTFYTTYSCTITNIHVDEGIEI